MWDAVFPVEGAYRILQEFKDIIVGLEIRERLISYEARRGPREKELYDRLTAILGPDGSFYHPQGDMIPRPKIEA